MSDSPAPKIPRDLEAGEERQYYAVETTDIDVGADDKSCPPTPEGETQVIPDPDNEYHSDPEIGHDFNSENGCDSDLGHDKTVAISPVGSTAAVAEPVAEVIEANGVVEAEAIPALTAEEVSEEIAGTSTPANEGGGSTFVDVIGKMWSVFGFILVAIVFGSLILFLLIAHVFSHILHVICMFIGKHLWDVQSHDKSSGLACVCAILCLVLGAPFVLAGYAAYLVAFASLHCTVHLPIVGEKLKRRAEFYHIYNPV